MDKNCEHHYYIVGIWTDDMQFLHRYSLDLFVYLLHATAMCLTQAQKYDC